MKTSASLNKHDEGMRRACWPNPAPHGPFRIIQRIIGERIAVPVTHYEVNGIAFLVPDGEPLTDILNRAYALAIAAQKQESEELAIKLAAGALHELAEAAQRITGRDGRER